MVRVTITGRPLLSCPRLFMHHAMDMGIAMDIVTGTVMVMGTAAAGAGSSGSRRGFKR